VHQNRRKSMKLLRNPARQLVKTLVVCGALSAMGATQLFAQTIYTLGGLVADNGIITIGDKTFSGFGWQTSDPALSSQAANLAVTAFIGSDGVYYLDFSGALTENNLQGSSILLGDLSLSYTVIANPGSINMIDQAYTPLPAAVPGSGQIIIGETVANNQGVVVANSTLTLNPPVLSDPPAQPGDNLNINPSENQLYVSKDILIIAYAGNVVGLTNVEQSFHQVPEPGTMLLGSLGGGLLLFLRSRRNARRN